MNLVTLKTPVEYRGRLAKAGELVQLDDDRLKMYQGEGLVAEHYDHALVRKNGKLQVVKTAKLAGVESQDIIERLTAEQAEQFKWSK